MLACEACNHPNRDHRGFCGGCGAMLQAVCRGCRFVNDRTDHYCGGCGSSLQMRATGDVTPVAIVVTRRVAESATSDDELSELFAEKVKVPEDCLPAAGITQDDLDRLFGGAA